MSYIFIIVQVLLLLIVPALLMRLNRRLGIEKVISDVVFCYGVGIIFANTQQFVLPAGETQKIIAETSEATLSISVLLAIPMLLMSMHLATWLRYTGKLLTAFLLGAFSVIVTCLLVSYWYKDSFVHHAESAGMLSAVFVGGTPNMAATAKAVDTSGSLFVILNAVEMFWGGLYFLFLTAFAPRVYRLFLRPFQYSGTTENTIEDSPEAHAHNPLPWTLQRFRAVAIGLGVSVLVVAASMGLGFLFPNNEGKLNQPIMMVGLTTFGICASMIRVLREQKGVYEFAEYLLLVFALAAGSMADFSQIVTQGVDFVMFTLWCLLGGVGLHLFLAVLFRIDRDTLMITSTANIFGPPFIGQVASVLGNKEIIGGGIAMGSLGLAIGNYVGVLVTYIAQLF